MVVVVIVVVVVVHEVVKTHIWRGTWRGRATWSRGCRRLGQRHERRGVVVGSDSGGGSGGLSMWWVSQFVIGQRAVSASI